MQNEPLTVDALIAKIKDRSDKVRAEGWASAGKVGAAAVKPLAAVMTSGDVDREVARAARQALVADRALRGPSRRREGMRGGAARIARLCWPTPGPKRCAAKCCGCFRRSATRRACPPIAACLKSSELLEDARCALTRIPGEESLAALKEALMTVPEKYRNNIAQSLRAAAWN